MSNLVTLEPGMTVVFHTVYECRQKYDVDVRKINRGNFALAETARKEKTRLEGALSGKSDTWIPDNEGRYVRGGAKFETRWFFVKRRKLFIQG